MTAHLFRLRWYTVFFRTDTGRTANCGEPLSDSHYPVVVCHDDSVPAVSGKWCLAGVGTAASPVQHCLVRAAGILFCPAPAQPVRRLSGGSKHALYTDKTGCPIQGRCVQTALCLLRRRTGVFVGTAGNGFLPENLLSADIFCQSVRQSPALLSVVSPEADFAAGEWEQCNSPVFHTNADVCRHLRRTDTVKTLRHDPVFCGTDWHIPGGRTVPLLHCPDAATGSVISAGRSGAERTGDLQLRGTAAAGFPADSGAGRTAVVWRCLRATANLCRHRENHFRRKAGLGTGLYRTALRRHLCCCTAFFPDCCIGAGADNISSPANGCSPSFSDSDAAVHDAAGLSGGAEAAAISVQKKECRINMRCCPKKHCIKIF